MDIEVKQLSVTFPSPMGAVRVLRDVHLLLHGGKSLRWLASRGAGNRSWARPSCAFSRKMRE